MTGEGSAAGKEGKKRPVFSNDYISAFIYSLIVMLGISSMVASMIFYDFVGWILCFVGTAFIIAQLVVDAIGDDRA
jgi:hypothetical protein